VFGWLVLQIKTLFRDTSRVDLKHVFSVLLGSISEGTMRGFFGRCGLVRREGTDEESTAALGAASTILQ
jgi:hypothetical protein